MRRTRAQLWSSPACTPSPGGFPDVLAPRGPFNAARLDAHRREAYAPAVPCWVGGAPPGRPAALTVWLPTVSADPARRAPAYLSWRPRRTTGSLSSTPWPPWSPHFMPAGKAAEGAARDCSVAPSVYCAMGARCGRACVRVCAGECFQRRLQSVT